MAVGFRLAAFALTGLALFGQAGIQTTQLRFAPGGQVSMDLASGDYDLEPGSGDWIVVTWEQGASEAPKVRLTGSGAQASLSIARTPHQGFHVKVALPARCDLRVRLTAGNLSLGPLEGNKDLAIRAGNLRVAVPQPGLYGPVHASVWAGNIHADAFGGEKDGLFRSFDWQGTGAYALHAAIWAGNITLSRP